MAKIVLYNCDRCSEKDTVENPIKSVTVVGTSANRGIPRLDLCRTCRIAVAEDAGHTPEHAELLGDGVISARTTRGSQPRR